MTCPEPRKEQEGDLFCAHGYTISALEIISSKEGDKLEALLPSPVGGSSDVVLPEAGHELGWNCLWGISGSPVGPVQSAGDARDTWAAAVARPRHISP